MQVAELQAEVADLKFDRSKWKPTKFGEVVACVDKTCRNPAELGLTRIVGLDNLDPGELQIKRWGDLSDGTSFTRSFRSGQVLFGKRRAYQRKVALTDFDGICSGDILVFEPTGDDLIPDLLPFLVQSEAFFAHALGTSAGSLSPRTKWKELAKWEFLLPIPADQERIAEILWNVEKSILQFREASINSNALRKALVSQSLNGVAPTTLGAVITRLTPGKSIGARNTSAGPHSKGVLKVSAIGRAKFVPEENKELFDPSDFRDEFAVRDGDFLISRCNTAELVGQVCRVRGDFPNLMLCDKTIRVEVDQQACDVRFLLEILGLPSVRRQISSVASGTSNSMKNISQDAIRNLAVMLPAPKAQRDICDQLESVDRMDGELQHHISNLQDLKAAICFLAFGGIA